MSSNTRPCAVCGSNAGIQIGMTLPFCTACEIAWMLSPQREQAASARADFVEARKKELAKK